MGGNRCIFQGCQVSTQRNPKMHFFKLPVRDPELLKVWLKNCCNAEILNIPREKLSSRAVCARHFRVECFMNYKLDRLVQKQAPTLMRISKDGAWDVTALNENGAATFVTLKPPTQAHLIPPEGFECPLGLDEMSDGRYGRKYEVHQLRPLDWDEISAKKVQKDIEPAPKKSKSVGIAMEPKKEYIPLINPESIEIIEESSQETVLESREEIDKLLQKNESLQRVVEKLKSQVDITPPSQPPRPAVPSAQQLTKSQLYNGIKKYLSPRMATLLRMEMFGGGERAWQEDELEFAMELLQLGENVYHHCCEEWRFRLPSLRITRDWSQNPTNPADKDAD